MEAYRAAIQQQTISASIDTPEERNRIKLQIAQLNRYILTLQGNCIRRGTPSAIFSQALEFFQIHHYNDVVQERLIQSLCSFPLCSNSLPTPHLLPSTKEVMYRNKVAKHENREVRDLEKIESYCSRLCMNISLKISQQISTILPYSRIYDNHNYHIDIPLIWPPPSSNSTDHQLDVSSTLSTVPAYTINDVVDVPKITNTLHQENDSNTTTSSSSIPNNTLNTNQNTNTSARSSSVTSSQSLLEQQLRNVGINMNADSVDNLKIIERKNNGSSINSTTAHTITNSTDTFIPNAIEGFIQSSDSSATIPSPNQSTIQVKTRSRYIKSKLHNNNNSSSSTISNTSSSSSPNTSTSNNSLDAYVAKNEELIDLQAIRNNRQRKYVRNHTPTSSPSDPRSRTNSTISNVSTKVAEREKIVTTSNNVTTNLPSALVSRYTNRNTEENNIDNEEDLSTLIQNDFSNLFLELKPSTEEWTNRNTNPRLNHNAVSELLAKKGEDKILSPVESSVSNQNVNISIISTPTKSILKSDSNSNNSVPVDESISSKITESDNSFMSDIHTSTKRTPTFTKQSSKKQVHFDDAPTTPAEDNGSSTSNEDIHSDIGLNNDKVDDDDDDEDEWWKRYVGDDDEWDDGGLIDDEETEGTFGGIWYHSSVRLPYQDTTGKSTGYESAMKALQEERGDTRGKEEDSASDALITVTKSMKNNQAIISLPDKRTKKNQTTVNVEKSDILGFGSIEGIGLGYSKEADNDSDDENDVDAVSNANNKSNKIMGDGLEHPISISVSNQRAFGMSSYSILWSKLSSWRTNATITFLCSGLNNLRLDSSSKDMLDLRNYVIGQQRTSLPAETDTSLHDQQKAFNSTLSVAIARRDLLLSYIGRAVKWIINSVSSSSVSSSITDELIQYALGSSCEKRLPILVSTWSMREPIPLLTDYEWRILTLVIIVVLYYSEHHNIILDSDSIPNETIVDNNDNIESIPSTNIAIEPSLDTVESANTLFTYVTEEKMIIRTADTLIKEYQTNVKNAEEAKKLKKKSKIMTKETLPPVGTIITLDQIGNLCHQLTFGSDVSLPTKDMNRNQNLNNTAEKITNNVPTTVIRGTGSKFGTNNTNSQSAQEALMQAELEMLEAYRQLGGK